MAVLFFAETDAGGVFFAGDFVVVLGAVCAAVVTAAFTGLADDGTAAVCLAVVAAGAVVLVAAGFLLTV